MSIVDGKVLGDLIVEPALGIDVARWQSEVIPYRECAELGIRFVSVKGFHGHWKEPAAERQYKDAKNAGLLAGFYGWWKPSEAWELQVAAWCATSFDDDLPFSIDAEENPANKAQARLDLIAINERVKQLTGRAPIIYGGHYWIDQWIGTEASEELAASPLWLPAYPRKSARGTNYAAALAEWLATKAPGNPAIWKDRIPVAWQLDGTDDKTGTGALRLPKPGSKADADDGIDVDVDLADWSTLSELVPALVRARRLVTPVAGVVDYQFEPLPTENVIDLVAQPSPDPALKGNTS